MEIRMTEGYSSEVFLTVTTQTTNEFVEDNDWYYKYSSLNCKPNWILDLLIFIIALVGLAGNGVIISLLGCCMQRNAISVYILNLAAADFLFLCCQLIYSLLTIYYEISFFFIIYIALIPYIAGLSILSAISFERCLCVLWPIWYRCHRPRHMSAAMCALLWTLSLLFSILDYYYSVIIDSYKLRLVDYIVAAWLFFLLLTLSVSSLALVVRIFYGTRRVPLSRLYVTTLLTVLVFLICGLPFGIYWFLLSWLQTPFKYFICRHILSVTLVLSCINSCANPIIYFLIGSFRQQHKSLKLALQRALEDSP